MRAKGDSGWVKPRGQFELHRLRRHGSKAGNLVFDVTFEWEDSEGGGGGGGGGGVYKNLGGRGGTSRDNFCPGKRKREGQNIKFSCSKIPLVWGGGGEVLGATTAHF